jgi:hypothetical protein
VVGCTKNRERGKEREVEGKPESEGRLEVKTRGKSGDALGWVEGYTFLLCL